MSAQLKVTINSDVIRRMHQHGRSSMKAEICGVLIGDHDDGRTVIRDCIRGEHSDQGGAHVTFTQDTWEHIWKIKDTDFPDDKIVGWYHSHPGFGIFLSDHDLFIHQNFFSAAHQVAWVYDPHSDEEGCFVWEEGRIERVETIEVVDTGPPPDDEPRQEPDPDTIQITNDEAENGGQPKPSRGGTSIGLILLLCALTAVAGFLLGKVTTTPLPAEKADENQDINATGVRVQQLARDIQALPALPKEKLREQVALLNRIPNGYSIIEMQPRQVVGGSGLPRPDVPSIIVHNSADPQIQSALADLHAYTVNFSPFDFDTSLVLRDWQIPNFIPPGLMIVHRNPQHGTIAATVPYDLNYQARLKQIVRRIQLAKEATNGPKNPAENNATISDENQTAPAGNQTQLLQNNTTITDGNQTQSPQNNATIADKNQTRPDSNATKPPAGNATKQPPKSP